MASSQIRLRILPSVRSLFDKLVQVRVEGLPALKPVELRSKLVDDRGMVFKASARYAADGDGQVDVLWAPSLGGSYTGVEPMGLFWSMAPETANAKLLKRTALSPTLVEVEAVCGDTGKQLASETVEREYMTEGMKRVPVQEGRIRGVLFVPPGKGPFPGILDLYTLGGGLTESRASLLANKGYVVLALAYYGYEDLPKKPKSLDLEYFEEGLGYLRSLPEVKGPGVGIISISHSGALALMMSSFLDGIKATVFINGCIGNTVIPLRYKNITVPPLIPLAENVKLTDSGLLCIRDALPTSILEASPASLIPIQRASCHFLFAASEDDGNWQSALYARHAAATLRNHGRANFQLVTYPGAGHFLEPPHTPHCPSGFHAAVGADVSFGGEPRAHAEAQLDLWARVQHFFKSHLGQEGS